ncbi:MAG: fused MFS/spermidine synthase [Vicinamibacterales bacterium]
MLCSSVLMFLLEPMAAKMVLPMLGGAPAVWNTCVVFFQGMLLAGYAYVHLGPKWLGLRRHATLHVVVLLLSTLLLQASLRIDSPPGGSNPILWLLQTLLKSIGLPFFLLCTTAPLLQRWFSRTRHHAANDPYFLYAASNFGSLAGLLMYPILVEPLLPLRVQASYWKYGYGIFTVVVVACVILLRRNQHPSADSASELKPSSREAHGSKLGMQRRLRWVALSFAPSSLMLAVTTFISTDVAAVPLLWVLPLALYLLTFILAFSSPPRYRRAIVDRALPLLILLLVLLLILRVHGPLMAVVPIHLAVFFLAALVCHRALADDRPAVAHLTEFYLLVALGGVLGSLFNTLAAPLLFTGIVEYPIVLVLVCLLRDVPAAQVSRSRTWILATPVFTVISTIAVLIGTSQVESLSVRFALLSLPAFLGLSLSRTGLPFAVAIAGMLVATAFQPDPQGSVLYAERSFFGAYKVRLERGGVYRSLTHGTTLHGLQSLAPARRAEPLSYYHRTGPLGDVFREIPIAAEYPRIGVVGLGVGSVATYRTASQLWTFFEIDPTVEKIARRQDYFSYLSDCGVACRVVIGDARQSLAVDSAHYGVIVLDAFSSDAIPMHLVTREAVDLYLRRLAEGGVLVLHISNRHLNLEPVLATLADRAGLVSLIRSDHADWDEQTGKTGSEWMVMSRKVEDLGSLSSDRNWRATRSAGSVNLWTDDFSNILTLLMHR